MIATKRFNRQGLIISVLSHVGILAVVLLFARAASQEAVPPDAIVPPDAMQVEIVMPNEMPRYSGTPSALRTSGTEQAAQSQDLTAKGVRPPTATPPPQPKDERQAQQNAVPKPRTPQAAPPQAKGLPLPLADTAQVATAETETDPPTPSGEETSAEPDIATPAELLALAGGRLGGGFSAPPINSPLVGYDFTVQFREVVSSCGAPPPGTSPNEKINIRVRVFLNRDGTLAAKPQLIESNPSAEEQALMQSFVSGLQKCQPYTMLPPDRYYEWKTLDLVVRPHNYPVQ
jgi:hypothetical protein